MKVIIAGGRDFDDIGLLNRECNHYLRNQEAKDITIVSGLANGADLAGLAYGVSRSLKIKQFPAHWKQFGRSAGMIRNREMADYSDALIAFWDGKSKGTEGMIKIAKKQGLKVKVIRY
jgi:hypothetical protein